LGRLVEDVAHLVQRKRLLLYGGRHHNPCGRRPDRPGELRLDKMDEFGIGDQLVVRPAQATAARILGKRAVGGRHP
jgi:hypothetical protein